MRLFNGKSRWVWILLAARVVFLSGCTSENISQHTQSPINIERVASEEVLVSKTYAYEDTAGGLIIRGIVKRQAYNCCKSAYGHVDIAVVTDNGIVLDEKSVMYSPRNIPKTRTRSAKFETHLDYIPPEGTSIRITYHKSTETAKDTGGTPDHFSCSENMASQQGQI